MKKFAIGCLSAIGALMVLVVIIGIITTIFDSSDTTETTPVQTTPVETGAETLPSVTTPTVTGPPTQTTPTGTMSTEQPPIEVMLMAAQNDGLIDIDAYGTGSLESIELSITSYSSELLNVSVLPGTIFVPQSTVLLSNMVVTQKKEILVEPYGTSGPVYIDVASADMELDVPGESDSLALSPTAASGDLALLLNLADFSQETLRLQQFAIWTITDNPRRGDYAAIATGFQIFGTEPSDEEIERIRILFENAGIVTDNYWALMTPVYVELIDGQSRGLIEVSALGTGSIDRIQLSLTSNSDDFLEVAVLPGTIFTSSAAGVQSMVVVATELAVRVYPHETTEPFDVDAACANMELDAPGQSNSLTLSLEAPPEDLMKLLNLPDFHGETYRVQQFAIWTITDNPPRDGYVGIGRFGMGTGPSDEEMARIRILFEKAGIPTDKYQALS